MKVNRCQKGKINVFSVMRRELGNQKAESELYDSFLTEDQGAVGDLVEALRNLHDGNWYWYTMAVEETEDRCFWDPASRTDTNPNESPFLPALSALLERNCA